MATNDPGSDAIRREIILRHYRSPRTRGTLASPDAEGAAHNPLCGDEVTVQIRVRDGVVVEARFAGHGCSVSQAASSMVTAALEGKSIAEARAMRTRFEALLLGDADAAADASLGDLRALAGAGRLPARLRCALLPWDAFSAAVQRLPAPDA